MIRIRKNFFVSVSVSVLAVLLLSSPSAVGLRNVIVPAEMQTQDTEPVARTISLKLPVKNVHFHWEFLDQSELLAGSLLLRITREETTVEIVVYQDGEFSEGWGPLIDDSIGKRGEDPIYFGFKSKRTYLTAPGDKVEIVLSAEQDLAGIGALLAGHLPAGAYTSVAGPGWLTDKDQASVDPTIRGNAAFENWAVQWAIVVTSDEGWLPPDQAEALKKQLEALDAEDAKRKNEIGSSDS